MNILWEELVASMPDPRQLARLLIRLVIAMLLGAIIGIQRERTGKPAGLRTHMLVSMGAALFVLAPIELGMNNDDLSRIIQGIVTGIGFIGGGAILKLVEEREIEGLTTAAGIFVTAASGVAVGLGRIGLAVISAILGLITLSWINRFESRIEERLRN
ncbi:MAG: MgtC/SapB family protein [Acidobacteria bacterium]|nr:MgtC/SapB family protein [Acidobacteriota bacterium]